MTERKWTPEFGAGCFSTNHAFKAYLEGFNEAIWKTAAPDLYEALEELERRITDQGFPYDGHMLTTCRAALAKARGE